MYNQSYFNEGKPNSSVYIKLSQKVKKNKKGLKKLKIAVLSSSTLDIIQDYLIVELARRGIKGILLFLPPNQFEQQILDDNSTLYEFNPDIVFLIPNIEDLCVNDIGFIKENLIKVLMKRYKLWISELRKKCDATILATNFQATLITPSALDDGQSPKSLNAIIIENNSSLSKYCKKKENCCIFDLNNLILTFGSKDWTDQRFFYIGKIRQSYNAQVFFADAIARILAAILFTPRKCIVLDADNTLWGGVVGEEGINGIELSDSFPGNVYKEFQKYLLRQRARGIILAIVSKNNEDDVLSVLKNHKDSLLKPKHFSCFKINWKDKARNIIEVAEELNIGLDSIVFIDDNPVEREWVKNKISDVLIPDLPSSPTEYINSIEKLEAFDFLSITNEDKKRADMYYQEGKRKKEKIKFNTIEDFLKNLKMEASVEDINQNNLKRVIQLLNKTNQFNLTVRRHNETDLRNIIKNGGIGITLRLKDKFGDSGLIGLAIANSKNAEKNCWGIDSFLLSCRVLGRKVEDLLLSLINEKIKSKHKKTYTYLEGEFIKGKKNSQVSDFFPKRGFKILNGYDNRWSRDVLKYPIERPKYIQVNFDGPKVRKKA